MKVISLLLCLSISVCSSVAYAQPGNYFFRQVTVDDGLNDGIIGTICQDKYGFMWFGSLGGLNRYDGYSTRVFSNLKGDTNSTYSNVVESSCLDANGNIYFGYRGGMVRFNYQTEKFSRIKALEGQVIFDMVPVSADTIFLASGDGLVRYNPINHKVYFYGHQPNAERAKLFKRCGALARLGNNIYFQTAGGIMVMNITTESLKFIPVPEIENAFVPSIAVTREENIFIVCNGKNLLLMIGNRGKTRHNYNNQVSAIVGASTNNVSHVYCDHHNKVWVTTLTEGIMEYEPASDSFYKYKYKPNRPGSIHYNINHSIYEDKNGIIWIANYRGVTYFNPSKTLFSTIMPFADSLDESSRRLARGITEDRQGNLWFATVAGASKQDKKTGNYYEWKNSPGTKPVLYSNSVRSIIADDNNDIWIPNGAGVNCYNNTTGQVEFIDPNKLPKSFYFSANRDSSGRIWFGCRDYDGFYWYEPGTRTFHSIKEIEAYKSFAGLGGRYVLEDSRHRMWFGFNGDGIGMYDPNKKKAYRWSPDDDTPTLAGGMVIDIKEDKNGIIWISTANGITGINADKNVFTSFDSRNGLLSNTTSALIVDDHNRLWIATSRGLNMIDSSRKFIKSFSMHDGLPTNEFPEFPAVKLKSGAFAVPSLNGFVIFEPENYSDETQQLRCEVASYKIGEKEYYLPEKKDESFTLNFDVDENFFALNLLAINYQNQNQTWYAYQLEGLDKDWHYTKDKKAVYTNVPGGNYLFKFKATTNPNNWNVQENQLNIRVATVFYKSVLFRLIIALAAAVFVYLMYRYRIKQQEQLYSLESKAYLLEQEKTRIMYDNLKQQLNPHFLFNSLTSLSGLIEIDQRLATNFLEQMSKIYRYILKNSDKELVAVRDEINFTQVYVTLQQTRFSKGLTVNINVSEDYMNYQIAPVTLQNLVENAIKHNIIDTESPLQIDIFIKDDYIIVKNNLQAKSMVETSNKKGLTGLRNLYRFFTPKPVVIEKSETWFAIHIPLIK